MAAMKLVIMTKSTFFVEEDKILTALFDEGMDKLHLYKPGSQLVFSERLLSLVPEGYHDKIVVHEHFRLKNEYDLAGIHLNRPTEFVPNGIKGKVSRTCEDLSLLKDMKKSSNYVFLRRIFSCTGDAEQPSSFSVKQLEEAAEQGLIDKRVYALGGIDIDNVRMAKELGFGGVVVCSDLWKRFDIHNGTDFRDLLALFRNYQKVVG